MIGHLLNRTLTVHRATATTDGVGGQTITYAQVGTVRAQVNQPTAEQRQAAGQWAANLSHIVHTLPGADVQRGDELGGDLPSDIPSGARLRVLSTVANSRDTYTRLDVEITQPEG
jgi:head-tail adaptor